VNRARNPRPFGRDSPDSTPSPLLATAEYSVPDDISRGDKRERRAFISD